MPHVYLYMLFCSLKTFSLNACVENFTDSGFLGIVCAVGCVVIILIKEVYRILKRYEIMPQVESKM